MTSAGPRLVYTHHDGGRVSFEVIAANGEPQMRSERYASLQNAKRGYNDLLGAMVIIGPDTPDDDGAQ